MRQRTTWAIGVVIAGLLLSACSAEPAETPTAADNPYGGFDVPPPAPDDIVLSVDGPMPLELSLLDLESFPRASVTILEPFVQEEHTYHGVLLEDIFARAGISPEATVDTIALNDYRYSDAAQALITSGAILAFSEDGGPIAMNRGGPIRIVFADDSDYFTELEAWNWSLRTIRQLPE